MSTRLSNEYLQSMSSANARCAIRISLGMLLANTRYLIAGAISKPRTDIAHQNRCVRFSGNDKGIDAPRFCWRIMELFWFRDIHITLPSDASSRRANLDRGFSFFRFAFSFSHSFLQTHTFLDGFYMSRIGIRILIGHYLALQVW